jgi:Fur family transcriptional regulator, ferric uptake regulator
VTTANLHREIEQRLQTARVRYTKGRRAVIELLATADGPLSASEVHDRLEGAVPLSSIYRSLSVLEEADVLIPHFGQKGLTRYELAEWLLGHHHHLVCIDCGGVEDFELPDPMEAEVTRLVRGIGDLTKFEPVNHALEIEGRCARCA